jgi:hypothetical protein
MKAFDRPALTVLLIQGARDLSLNLSEAQITKLIDYLALMAKWNSVYNLTAVRDPHWRRYRLLPVRRMFLMSVPVVVCLASCWQYGRPKHSLICVSR